MARENGWTAEWLAERERKMDRWARVGHAIAGPIMAVTAGIVARELVDRKYKANAAPSGQRGQSKAKPTPIYPLVGLCRAAGLPEPVPEYRFAWPARRFSADYCWPLHRLIVEIDGSIWQRGGGGHSHPLGILRDMERDNYAALLGFRTMRYTPAQMTNECLHDLKIIFAKE